MSEREILEYLGLPMTIRTLPEPDTRAIVERLKALSERVDQLAVTLTRALAEGTPKP